MKRFIPAKTFLSGEYVALKGGPAVILTTTPCFEVTQTEDVRESNLHPSSPAGRYLQALGDKGVHFNDPYQGLGGLGASSAQFVGVYQGKHARVDDGRLLEAYFDVAWQGTGARPSGYDVLAQARSGCVCIHRNAGVIEHMPWPFTEIGFVIVHTGKKLATHTHLESLETLDYSHLDAAALAVFNAFRTANAAALPEAVNAFQEALTQSALTAPHSLQALNTLGIYPEVLAAKACGAMGADTLLLLTAAHTEQSLGRQLAEKGWNVLATRQNLFNIDTTTVKAENIYSKST